MKRPFLARELASPAAPGRLQHFSFQLSQFQLLLERLSIFSPREKLLSELFFDHR